MFAGGTSRHGNVTRPQRRNNRSRNVTLSNLKDIFRGAKLPRRTARGISGPGGGGRIQFAFKYPSDRGTRRLTHLSGRTSNGNTGVSREANDCRSDPDNRGQRSPLSYRSERTDSPAIRYPGTLTIGFPARNSSFPRIMELR